VGSVAPTGDALEPFHLVDVDAELDQWVRGFVRHLVACDYSAATCRSYLPAAHVGADPTHRPIVADAMAVLVRSHRFVVHAIGGIDHGGLPTTTSRA
jgi:hypothetical protein